MAPKRQPGARRGGHRVRTRAVGLALCATVATGLSSALLFVLAPPRAGIRANLGAESQLAGAYLDGGRGSRTEHVARAAAAPAVEEAGESATVPSRRELASAAAFGALSAALPEPASADAEPEIKARCSFDITIGGGTNAKKRRLVIGLYRDLAPVLTQNFIYAVTQTYPGEGQSQITYKLGDVKSIEKDKAINWVNFREGNVLYKEIQTDDKRWVGNKVVKVPLAGDDTLTDETNSLRHDAVGRVSMKKGGGSFDFTVSPVAEAPWLDKTNVVIGQVLEGMDVIAEINQIPMFQGKPFKKVRFVSSRLMEAV